jgi:TAT (twin-arginine translocation) pathway signal sequence
MTRSPMSRRTMLKGATALGALVAASVSFSPSRRSRDLNGSKAHPGTCEQS